MKSGGRRGKKRRRKKGGQRLSRARSDAQETRLSLGVRMVSKTGRVVSVSAPKHGHPRRPSHDSVAVVREEHVRVAQGDAAGRAGCGDVHGGVPVMERALAAGELVGSARKDEDLARRQRRSGRRTTTDPRHAPGGSGAVQAVALLGSAAHHHSVKTTEREHFDIESLD